MEKYEIEMYDKEDGSCPVAEFLDELEPKMVGKGHEKYRRSFGAQS